jgi:hypothetical protein
MKTDRPRPFTFIIRGLWTMRAIERTFCAESETDRNDWIRAIESVAESLESPGGQASASAQGLTPTRGTELGSPSSSSGSALHHSSTDDDFSRQFGCQGVTCDSSSGKSKVVSYRIARYQAIL